MVLPVCGVLLMPMLPCLWCPGAGRSRVAILLGACWGRPAPDGASFAKHLAPPAGRRAAVGTCGHNGGAIVVDAVGRVAVCGLQWVSARAVPLLRLRVCTHSRPRVWGCVWPLWGGAAARCAVGEGRVVWRNTGTERARGDGGVGVGAGVAWLRVTFGAAEEAQEAVLPW